MPQSMKLLFLAGSARTGSLNKKLARLGHDIAKANGISATLVDLADYPMPLYDGDLETAEGAPENARKLAALFGVHDGIFIAAPEYNAGITPLLKNTIDWVSRVKAENGSPGTAIFNSRVFALGAASPGGFGGMRGLMHVRQVLELGLGALVLPDQIAVPRALTAFEDNGHMKDQSLQEAMRNLVHKLGRAARIMHG